MVPDGVFHLLVEQAPPVLGLAAGREGGAGHGGSGNLRCGGMGGVGRRCLGGPSESISSVGWRGH